MGKPTEIELGTNLKAGVDGDILTITVDLSKRHGKSKSGKSEVVATTGGNVALPNGVKIGINAYMPV